MGEVEKLRNALAIARRWNAWYVEAFLASELPYAAEGSYDWAGAFDRGLTPEQAAREAQAEPPHTEPTD